MNQETEHRVRLVVRHSEQVDMICSCGKWVSSCGSDPLTSARINRLEHLLALDDRPLVEDE
jgi:hypothetical protein